MFLGMSVCGVEPPFSCTCAQEGFPEPYTDNTRMGFEPTTATPNGRCSAYYANVRLMSGTRTPSPPLTRGALPIEPNNKQELHGTRTACYHAPNLRNPRTGTADKFTQGICYIWLIQHLYPKYIKLLNRYLVNSDRIYHHSLILLNCFYV